MAKFQNRLGKVRGDRGHTSPWRWHQHNGRQKEYIWCTGNQMRGPMRIVLAYVGVICCDHRWTTMDHHARTNKISRDRNQGV
jgi:hypothetical protein